MLAADKAEASVIVSDAPPAGPAPGGVIVGPDTGTSIAQLDDGGSGEPEQATAPMPSTDSTQGSAETLPQPTPCPDCYQAAPADQAAPTGAPPDGDAALPPGEVAPPVDPGQSDSQILPATPAAIETRAGIVPQPGETQLAERVEERPSSPTGELQASSREVSGNEDGNTDWLLVVEIAAGAVTVAAIGGYAAWRLRRRGESG
jgi:hypothetical protein